MKTITQGNPLFDPAKHLAAGAFDVDDIAVGIHDLSRLRVTAIFGAGAAVERSKGNLGDGYNTAPFPETISLAAALLFIQRAGLDGPTVYGLIKACIVEAAEKNLKAKDLMFPEASRALADLQALAPPACKPRKKTPATRIGVSDVQIEIEQMSIAAHKALSGPNRPPAPNRSTQTMVKRNRAGKSAG